MSELSQDEFAERLFKHFKAATKHKPYDCAVLTRRPFRDKQKKIVRTKSDDRKAKKGN